MKSTTTGVSPFFVKKGYHPSIGIEDDVPILENLSAYQLDGIEKANAYTEKLKLISQYC